MDRCFFLRETVEAQFTPLPSMELDCNDEVGMKRAPQNDLPIPSSEVGPNEKGEISTQGQHWDDKELAYERKIVRRQLINKLNHLNFQDLTVTVVFKHVKFPRTLSFKAAPQPCHDKHLTCSWVEHVDVDQIMESYQFQCLYVPSGQQLLKVEPELKSITSARAVLILPEICREISIRKIHRHSCSGVAVYMFQNSALFQGELVDYGAFQFRISVRTIPPQTYHWIDVRSPATIVFARGQNTLFSGECHIVKKEQGVKGHQLILEPANRQVRRFAPKEFRSTRQKISPSPDAIFSHPLFGKTINLKVVDISGSGISVEEEEHLAVLLPGMIVPSLELRFADGSILSCLAQVVYSIPHREGPGGAVLRCGMAILDMAIEDHKRLLALLHQASDARAYLCNKIDMDSLWNFFFETGFIYPQKYEFIQANKEKIKATYEKLYHHSPDIAGHFVYQENGRILAHMAMVRFYENSWLIHHHAAIRSSGNRGGLMVLNQVNRFLNDSHRLYSMKMDYVFCYYRPDNKFPNHVFGGTARNINDRKKCSVDKFAYFHHATKRVPVPDLPGNWHLNPADEEDLLNLQTDYDDRSGGLMLHSLQLLSGQTNIDDLSDAYETIGLRRSRQIFALKRHDRLYAIVVANAADLGLNMSDLTNSINLLITNEKHLTYEIVEAVIARQSRLVGLEEIPVLMYPRRAAEKVGIDFRTTYCLWSMHTHGNADLYLRFLKRLLKFIKV